MDALGPSLVQFPFVLPRDSSSGSNTTAFRGQEICPLRLAGNATATVMDEPHLFNRFYRSIRFPAAGQKA